MKIIDLSHVIEESMPVYPGTAPPRIAEGCTVGRHGFAEKVLTLYSHTGTHIDAPGHMLEEAPRLDTISAGHFLGPGRVLDVSAFKGRQIEIADLEPHGAALREVEYALLHSGWSRFWGEGQYYGAYPVLSEGAARWLARFSLKGVGVDMISIDSLGSTAMTNHRIFLEKKIVIVENLTGLGALLGKPFLFSCLPLKLASGDGSPVRAVAFVEG
jgi:kynurenine formamidase